jgi:hypothetical protein
MCKPPVQGCYVPDNQHEIQRARWVWWPWFPRSIRYLWLYSRCLNRRPRWRLCPGDCDSWRSSAAVLLSRRSLDLIDGHQRRYIVSEARLLPMCGRRSSREGKQVDQVMVAAWRQRRRTETTSSSQCGITQRPAMGDEVRSPRGGGAAWTLDARHPRFPSPTRSRRTPKQSPRKDQQRPEESSYTITMNSETNTCYENMESKVISMWHN